MAEDDLAVISIEYARYIEQRTRDAEREEYFRAKESRQRNSFPAYLQALLQAQRQKQADTQALLQEQQEILQGLGLQEDDKLKVVCSSAGIFSENVASRAKEPAIQLTSKLLTLKTEYLRAEGERIVAELRKAKDLNLEELPGVLGAIVNEAVFSSHPEYAFLDNVLETNHCIGTLALIQKRPPSSSAASSGPGRRPSSRSTKPSPRRRARSDDWIHYNLLLLSSTMHFHSCSQHGSPLDRLCGLRQCGLLLCERCQPEHS